MSKSTWKKFLFLGNFHDPIEVMQNDVQINNTNWFLFLSTVLTKCKLPKKEKLESSTRFDKHRLKVKILSILYYVFKMRS